LDFKSKIVKIKEVTSIYYLVDAMGNETSNVGGYEYESSEDENAVAWGDDGISRSESTDGDHDGDEEGKDDGVIDPSAGAAPEDRWLQLDELKRRQEMNEFGRANFSAALPSDPWYIVSAEWHEAWQQYVFFGLNQHPGAITNARLVRDETVVRLSQGAQGHGRGTGAQGGGEERRSGLHQQYQQRDGGGAGAASGEATKMSTALSLHGGGSRGSSSRPSIGSRGNDRGALQRRFGRLKSHAKRSAAPAAAVSEQSESFEVKMKGYEHNFRSYIHSILRL